MDNEMLHGINEGLVAYVLDKILPEYELNDQGHGLGHAEYVIRRSLAFADRANADKDMAFAIAAYHDVAAHVDHDRHEALAAERLAADENLKEFFTDDQIALMSDAVADHRASSGHDPRSIYGKIVSSADRDTDVNSPLRRAYLYRVKNEPWLSFEANMAESRHHLMRKYGPDGYAKAATFFDDPEYDSFLANLSRILTDDGLFDGAFRSVNM